MHKKRCTVYYVSPTQVGVMVQDNASNFTVWHREYNVASDVLPAVLSDVRLALSASR